MEAEENQAHAQRCAKPGGDGKQDWPPSDNRKQVQRYRIGKSRNAQKDEDREHPVSPHEALAQIEEPLRPVVAIEVPIELCRPFHPISHQKDYVRSHCLSKNSEQEDPRKRNVVVPEERYLTRRRQDYSRANFIQKDEEKSSQDVHTRC